MELSYNNEFLNKILEAANPLSVNNFNQRFDKNNNEFDFFEEDSQEKSIFPNNNIKYNLNKFGFRSQSFENFNKSNTNILYAGCSFTFGLGLPEQYMWSNILTNKIKTYTNQNIESFNIGYRAFSNYLIVKNIMSFIRIYGKPDYLFVLFPDCARDFIFNEKTQQYQHVFPRFFNKNKSVPFEIKYTKNFSYETNFLKSSDMIKNLEDFCKESGIKLIWTTWYYPDFEIYQKVGFNNLLITDTTFLQANTGYQRIYTRGQHGVEYSYENKNKLPYWEVARDLVHPGTAWTNHISDEFFGEFVK